MAAKQAAISQWHHPMQELLLLPPTGSQHTGCSHHQYVLPLIPSQANKQC
jgi:hypothetical protein